MKIMVGLSGGVDSAVAAYLLKQQGHDVTCAFMRNWDSGANNDVLGNPTTNDDICPQEKDYNDAKSVAEKLGLPLLRIDFIEEYWNEVFMQFIEEYKKGRTPNPDILCNKYIKFDHFLEFARKNGFEYLATGHYCKRLEKDGKVYLAKADDRNKDQSYFLAQVSAEAISKTYFPLGEIDKPEVRRIAQELGLSVADKKDSTGICFIGERNFRQFLQNYLPAKEGKIIDLKSGKVLGEHIGVLYYTIGQRKGLNLSGGPWFVADKDVEKNILYVVNLSYSELLNSDSCLVSGFNHMTELRPENCCAKFRYRQSDNEVRVEYVDESTVRLYYPQGVKSVTPGQQAVLYLGDICLGGGVIEETYYNNKPMHIRLKEISDGTAE
ncbi:MAG: tRNA 2-thiouridine(34) synthase MnmA [Erysipelotrichaceae bacterium]|nr:tRNA 2-thiouridine(34) synthase MnmA [Erysipelotrichaceae bacterium]